MKTTINDIAKIAGVSNATVSHVINNTRFVSPEVQKRVWRIIEDTGYDEKLKEKNGILRIDGGCRIAMVVPNAASVMYGQFVQAMAQECEKHGYTLCSFFSFDNSYREKVLLNSLSTEKTTYGIFLIPTLKKSKQYEEIAAKTPMVCIDRTIQNSSIPCVQASNEEGVYRATRHLIRSGHKNILLLVDESMSSVEQNSISGYQKALQEYGIRCNENFVLCLKKKSDNENVMLSLIKGFQITACIATTNSLTQIALRTFNQEQIECPRDISLVGFGDSEWTELSRPPLTQFRHNITKMAETAMQLMLELLNKEPIKNICCDVPLDFVVRQSTQAICRGPFGESALPPEVNLLSDEECAELRRGSYSVAISYHDAPYIWTRLHEQAIRETLNSYGVSVVAVTDARNDYQMQVAQLNSLIMLKPDAIISLPVDEEKTADKYKEISTKTKLVFLNGMPSSMEPSDFYGWVSVNDWENGQIAAGILIDHFEGHQNVKIGLMTHGISFRGSHQREFIVEQRIQEKENMTIVKKMSFEKAENAYDACLNMMQQNPEIQGIYVTYSTAALHVIRALEELKREDVVIVTHDLDRDMAHYLSERKFVIGLSSQRYYEQGIAIANATAKALLGHTEHKSICVQPYQVLPTNLKRAWTDIIRSREPEFIKYI